MTDISTTPSEILPLLTSSPRGALGDVGQRLCTNPARWEEADLERWQNMTVNQQTIVGWGSRGNTGMRTAFMPVFDIDILDDEAALLVENVVRNFLEIEARLVRIGLPPKRAMSCARCAV